MSNNSFSAERLSLLRKLKKIKQKELAKKLGISPSTLSDYENGRLTPPMNVLINICDIFNVPTDYFYDDYRIFQYSDFNLDADNKPKRFIEVVSISLNKDNNDIVIEPIRSEPVPNNIPSDAKDLFYFEYNNQLPLFYTYEDADYYDTVLAFAPDSDTPDIFNAQMKDKQLFFSNSDGIYTMSELNIVGVMLIPMVHRKYIKESQKIIYGKEG